MSVRLNGNVIVLEGPCRVEDAEPLLGWLQADGSRVVELTAVEHLHTAVVQVLMALRPGIRGTGNDAFVRDWIVPALTTPEPADTMTQEG
ncbi:hypothetical protein [Microvirga subterranea]|uniref:STAS domain-containing protein n=1 Tax=Microvirga subterranea TaxID=186651 RepID=A0A370HI59_9HYPH|nr:hypothetical protein [Microvirga subterranea]RDI57342.1 hypothetical protein DES45_107262 [Microvirga subterranea]